MTTDEPSRLERALQPLFSDIALWPVTAVLVAHLVVAIAVMLLDVIRGPSGFSILSGVTLGLASLAALRPAVGRRRLGALAVTVLGSWIAGALAAWAADHGGLY